MVNHAAIHSFIWNEAVHLDLRFQELNAVILDSSNDPSNKDSPISYHQFCSFWSSACSGGKPVCAVVLNILCSFSAGIQFRFIFINVCKMGIIGAERAENLSLQLFPPELS